MSTRIEKLNTRIATLTARIEKDTAELGGVQLELTALNLIANISVGDAVTFAFGRLENRQELTGPVLAVAEDEVRGKLLRVFAGQGFEATTYTVQASAVIAVIPKDAGVQAVEQEAERVLN